MHDVLLGLEAELRNVAVAVKAVSADARAISIIHNNWSFASIDCEELSSIATKLADRIAAEGGDDLGVNEALLSQYVSRLQFLKKSTIPYIGNGHANHAIPAYLLTLEYLEHALASALILDPAKVDESAKAAKSIQTRLRGLNNRIVELEPKVDGLQVMANQIVQAHAAADRLPTDLATLRENREEIESLRKLVEQDKDAVNQNLQKIVQDTAKLQADIAISEQDMTERQQKWDAMFKNTTGKAQSIIDRCEDAMRTSTSFGLGGAFHAQAVLLTRSMFYWVGGLVLALGAGAYFGGQQLHQLSQAIEASTPPMIIWTRLFVSLLSVGAPVWFAWLATKQIGQRFRLAEDYAYKASISKAYEGYRREAVQLDADFQTKLFSSALARLDEQPLRFVEHETHGSPWHELLASDVFKDALKIAPELVGKFSVMAREKVEEARLRNVPSKPKSTSETPPGNATGSE